MELTKSDLLKLVTYFEGEIQARDIVIAALKVLRIYLLFYCSNCKSFVFLLVRKIEASC